MTVTITTGWLALVHRLACDRITNRMMRQILKQHCRLEAHDCDGWPQLKLCGNPCGADAYSLARNYAPALEAVLRDIASIASISLDHGLQRPWEAA